MVVEFPDKIADIEIEKVPLQLEVKYEVIKMLRIHGGLLSHNYGHVYSRLF